MIAGLTESLHGDSALEAGAHGQHLHRLQAARRGLGQSRTGFTQTAVHLHSSDGWDVTTIDATNLAIGLYSATATVSVPGNFPATLVTTLEVTNLDGTVFQLAVSFQSNRGSAIGLDRAVVSSDIYVFVAPPRGGINQVEFILKVCAKAKGHMRWSHFVGQVGGEVKPTFPI